MTLKVNFYGCSAGNIEDVVTGFQYDINSGVGEFVADGLDTGLDEDSDVITLRVYNFGVF